MHSLAVEAPVVEIPSFREVYDTHFDFVWRNVANRGVPRSCIDDVVQEVFIVVHHRLPTFEGRSSLRSWIAGIIRNVARDYVRKRRNALIGAPLDNEPSSGGASPAELVDRHAAVQVLDDVLTRMTDVQREVFLLYEVEQMSASEVADTVGVSENAVRMRVRGARKIFEAAVARLKAQRLWGERRG